MTPKLIQGPFLTTYELAARWQMHPTSILNWRVMGKGPKFIKIGRKVRYSLVEIERFEKANTKQNTAS